MQLWATQMNSLETLLDQVRSLNQDQIECVERIVEAFRLPVEIEWDPGSDFATEQFASGFADLLRVHHFFSEQAFTKDKFEYGMVRVLARCGRDAKKAATGKPGEDLFVDGIPWSLKTQADKGIKRSEIYISKFMELGKGDWANEADLVGLRQRMFHHMQAYERIFSLRCISASSQHAHRYEYELVEIPKNLLQESANHPVRMMQESRQTPKPGYCTVVDATGSIKFELYFDGGTERKLQIKRIQKDHCVVHASWAFSLAPTLLG